MSRSGRSVTDAATLARIRSLVIPPAWTEVWIAADPRAHIQVTGRDARGRKQYRYHPRWRDERHQTKYDRMVAFAHKLPQIRQTVARDLRQVALNKAKVVAAVVQLLERTLIRVGNEEYATSNRSYGLTTFRDSHVRIRGTELRFEFTGKSGIRHLLTIADGRLARIVRRCQELPGQELFQYIEESGARRSVSSADINAYVRNAADGDFTTKHFRTWAGTLLAAMTLAGRSSSNGLTIETVRAQVRRSRDPVVRAIADVAHVLGNTPAVCKACYIHPAVLAAHADGSLRRQLGRRRRRIRGLSAEETAVLGLLENRRDWRGQLAAAAAEARRLRRRPHQRRSIAGRRRLGRA